MSSARVSKLGRLPPAGLQRPLSRRTEARAPRAPPPCAAARAKWLNRPWPELRSPAGDPFAAKGTRRFATSKNVTPGVLKTGHPETGRVPAARPARPRPRGAFGARALARALRAASNHARFGSTRSLSRKKRGCGQWLRATPRARTAFRSEKPRPWARRCGVDLRLS